MSCSIKEPGLGRDDVSSETGFGVALSLTAFSTEPDFGVAVF